MAAFSDLELKVVRWAEARRIIPNSTPQAQLLKAFEEMGELAGGIARKDMRKIKDGMGDTIVCLINLCALLDISLTDCLELAYEEIKDRKGTMTKEGIFVKESDAQA